VDQEQGLAKIASALRKEKDRSAKAEFIDILGEKKYLAGIDQLDKALKDPDPIIRTKAIYALGKIKSPLSNEKILSMLDDETEGVKVAASDVSAQMGIDAAEPKIMLLLANNNQEVRLRAVEALQTVAKPGSVDQLIEYKKSEKDPAVAKALADLIQKLSEKEKPIP
jgi:HEAT repeat protein